MENETKEEVKVTEPQAPQAPVENPKKGNGFSVAALVLGLLACIGAFMPYITYIAWLVGIIAIVMGALGMKRSRQTNTGHGLAVAGLVLGIIGTVIGLIGFMCLVLIVAIAAS